MRTIVALLLVLVPAGCADREPVATTTPKPAPKSFTLEKYTMDLSAAQKEKILNDDPNPLVGRWELWVNRKLGIADVLAPDGGGFTVEIEDATADRWVVSQRECSKPFALAVEETGGTLRLTPEDGGCEEMADVLTINPWKPA